MGSAASTRPPDRPECRDGRRRRQAGAATLTALLLFPTAAFAQANGRVEARFPFPQHVTYAKGTRLPDYVPRARLDDDVHRFYAYWKRQSTAIPTVFMRSLTAAPQPEMPPSTR